MNSGIKLILGDIAQLSDHAKPSSADVIIFDPPYGIGSKVMTLKSRKWSKSAESWDQFDSVEHQYQSYTKWFGQLYDCLKNTGNLFVFGSFHSIYLCGEILQRQLGMKVVNSIVWYKNNAMFNVTQSGLIESTEHIIWAAKSKDYFFDYEASKRYEGKQLRNVWESPMTPTTERVGHPHQKPVWIVQRLLEIGCPAGGFVIDPMCGSGTTAVTCQGMNLDCLAIEKSLKYFPLAQERLEETKSIL